MTFSCSAGADGLPRTRPEHDGLELHPEFDPSAEAEVNLEPTVEARFTREYLGR